MSRNCRYISKISANLLTRNEITSTSRRSQKNPCNRLNKKPLRHSVKNFARDVLEVRAGLRGRVNLLRAADFAHISRGLARAQKAWYIFFTFPRLRPCPAPRGYAGNTAPVNRVRASNCCNHNNSRQRRALPTRRS